MAKRKDIKQLGVADRIKASEKLGNQVATIMNKAKAAANKILAETGYGVNVQLDFYPIENTKDQELRNG